jgi:hypothetical protein
MPKNGDLLAGLKAGQPAAGTAARWTRVYYAGLTTVD